MSREEAERLVNEFEDAVIDLERNDSSKIRRDEIAATRAALLDALTSGQSEAGSS